MPLNDNQDLQENQALSAFGYKEELQRTMGGFSSFALAFSMISVTTTVFTLFAQPFQTVGGIAIWLWLPVIAGTLLLASVYGHLAVRLPITGYAYHWASRLANPTFGWFTGWNALLCQFVGSAGIAVALASVFAPDFWHNPTHSNIIMLSGIGIIFAVIVNIISIKLTARINNGGAAVELVGTIGLTAILGIGIAFFAQKQGASILFQHGSSNGGKINITAIATALLLPIWTIAGWEGSADLAEETHDPRKVAPQAMKRSVIVSGLAGLGVFAIFAMAIPGKIGDTVNSTSSNPMISIFKSHFGQSGGFILQVVCFVSMFSCLLANVTVATRTCYSLSRDNMLPFSSVWSKVNPKTKTPIAAVILVGAFAIGVTFLSSGIASQVLGIVSVVLYITYGSVLVATVVGARNNKIPSAPANYYDMGKKLVPWSIVGIVWAVIVVLCMTLPAGSHVVAKMAIYFELAAAIWYFVALRSRLKKGTAGPFRTNR